MNHRRCQPTYVIFMCKICRINSERQQTVLTLKRDLFFCVKVTSLASGVSSAYNPKFLYKSAKSQIQQRKQIFSESGGCF